MKREQIINKIYDKIRDDLLHAKLLYWEEDDANKYPLVDHLSSGNDISTGRDEIDNLIEQIEIEPLIDAILTLPLEVPSDEEIKKEIFKRTTEPIPYTGKNYIPKPVFQFMEEISEWVKNEIIKRNK
jgi:hypothetical protein